MQLLLLIWGIGLDVLYYGSLTIIACFLRILKWCLNEGDGEDKNMERTALIAKSRRKEGMEDEEQGGSGNVSGLGPAVASAKDEKGDKGRISVVIPCYNEEADLEECLRSIHRDAFEVIVSDGGSTDRTVEIAGKFTEKVRVVSGGRNRSESMNIGAIETCGDLILFLHADTVLPLDWAAHVRTLLLTSPILKINSILVGAFEFGLKEYQPGQACIVKGTNLRSRVFSLPYGDQGLFMSKTTFEVLGGYPAVPFMEDLDFIKRARSTGRVVTVEAVATTSARRWVLYGCFWNTFTNQVVLFGDLIGVPRERLVKWYYGLTAKKEY